MSSGHILVPELWHCKKVYYSTLHSWTVTMYNTNQVPMKPVGFTTSMQMYPASLIPSLSVACVHTWPLTLHPICGCRRETGDLVWVVSPLKPTNYDHVVGFAAPKRKLMRGESPPWGHVLVYTAQWSRWLLSQQWEVGNDPNGVKPHNTTCLHYYC